MKECFSLGVRGAKISPGFSLRDVFARSSGGILLGHFVSDSLSGIFKPLSSESCVRLKSSVPCFPEVFDAVPISTNFLSSLFTLPIIGRLSQGRDFA